MVTGHCLFGTVHLGEQLPAPDLSNVTDTLHFVDAPLDGFRLVPLPSRQIGSSALLELCSMAPVSWTGRRVRVSRFCLSRRFWHQHPG